VALNLFGLGFKKVYTLKGGWNEWEKAGYPTEPKGIATRTYFMQIATRIGTK
jgi:3-mercaptopyruvate sulfurtransferase SseA